jgi:AraC-like DNA-binding protein
MVMAVHKHINLEVTGGFLQETLLSLMPETGSFEAGIKGLKMVRWNGPVELQRCFYAPMIIVIVQGTKHVYIGSQEYIYGENQCMIIGVELPSAGRITKASPDKPSMIVSLELDQCVIADLLAEIPQSKNKDKTENSIHRGMTLTQTDPYVLDAFLRLAELIDDKERQGILAPMIIREIHYRLLMGPSGDQLRMINTYGSQSNQIAQVITWLKTNYNKPVNVNELAKMVNMAPATFNRYFRQLTTLSPLQYQKRLRLYEAQRLMLVENENASNAAYAVGYESPPQFNREYKRMFGIPPLENKKKMLTS